EIYTLSLHDALPISRHQTRGSVGTSPASGAQDAATTSFSLQYPSLDFSFGSQERGRGRQNDRASGRFPAVDARERGNSGSLARTGTRVSQMLFGDRAHSLSGSFDGSDGY